MEDGLEGEDGFDLALLGFDQAALDALLAETGLDGGAGAGTDEDAPAPEPPPVPVTRPGDLWRLGRHRLFCGDATSAADVQRLLAGAKPHLLVSDPPYLVDYDPTWRNEAPSVPMMMRHLPPGNLDLRARKDYLSHAHAPETDRCSGR